MTKYILIIALFLFSIPQLFAQKEAKAKAGDGIYTLLTRYGLNTNNNYNTFLKLNKKRLNGKTSLQIGKTYLLPEKSTTTSASKPGVFPIFGKKYEKVETIDNKLRGAVYYVVGGHGGPDPGAVGSRQGHDMCEDEYAYDISLRLARELLSHGATVYVITRDPNDGIRDESYLKCDKDEVCYKNSAFKGGVTPRLRQKAAAINTLYRKHKGKYQRMIVLHLDSRTQNQNIDIFFYYHTANGKKLANTMLSTIEKKYKKHQPNRGYEGSVSHRNLYMLKTTHPVGVYLELGNIRNKNDQKRFILNSNRQAVANWLSDGLMVEYLNR